MLDKHPTPGPNQSASKLGADAAHALSELAHPPHDRELVDPQLIQRGIEAVLEGWLLDYEPFRQLLAKLAETQTVIESEVKIVQSATPLPERSCLQAVVQFCLNLFGRNNERETEIGSQNETRQNAAEVRTALVDEFIERNLIQSTALLDYRRQLDDLDRQIENLPPRVDWRRAMRYGDPAVMCSVSEEHRSGMIAISRSVISIRFPTDPCVISSPDRSLQLVLPVPTRNIRIMKNLVEAKYGNVPDEEIFSTMNGFEMAIMSEQRICGHFFSTLLRRLR